MQSPVVTILGEETVSRLCDVLQEHHFNGVPVVDGEGDLVGIVTEEDVLYGTMVAGDGEGLSGAAPFSSGPALDSRRVSEIMTAPAVCATEEADVLEVCRIMWTMRIHRVPIVRRRRVVGIVTAMDVVRAVAEGRIVP